MRAHILPITVAAVLALLPDSSAAQTSVADQLSRATTRMRGNRFAQAERDLSGNLNNSSRIDLNVYLVRSVDYRVFGFCDNDCRDLDLILYDENGNKVAEDTSTDDQPILSINPSWTGRFTLRVIMDDCRSNPCGWGVRFFAPR